MEKIKERKKQAWDNMIYSAQRFDLLIVSFCGAGIYVCLEIIKYYVNKDLSCSLIIKICGVTFILAVALNFLSQHFGLKANYYDYKMSDKKLEAEENKTNEIKYQILQKEIKKYDCLSEKHNKHTHRLNSFSMYLLFLGLFLMLIFFFTTV